MNPSCGDLILALKAAPAMAAFTPAQWDRIIPQARAAGLLGRLGSLATQVDLAAVLPVPVWHAMEAALAISERQAVAVRHELNKLDAALAGLRIPVLVLKGAAYVAAGSPAAAGRMMTDIDILVPKQAINETEAALMLTGWVSSHHDAYDQRYYRQWMHEIPPMQHIRRGTILDVHHNLLPETARIQTRPDRIIAAARPLPNMACLHVPSASDLILHSATHLMHEGEWDHGLRDLSDLYAMLAASSVQYDDFWPHLAKRALELKLERPLYLALVQLHRVFGLKVPAMNLPQASRFGDRIIHDLLTRALSGYHSTCRMPLFSCANFALFVRSHWLRMPIHLLIPHLLYKALSRESAKKTEG
jgi:hypothetical protein